MGHIQRKIRGKLRRLSYKVQKAAQGILPQKPQAPPAPPEEGLVYEMDINELLPTALSMRGYTYIPVHLKLYEDRLYIKLSITDGEEFRDEELWVDCEKDRRRISLPVDELPLSWDSRDRTLRMLPDFDPSVRAEINPCVAVLDSRVLWVEEAYAGHNLSSACLAYAFDNDGAGYRFSIEDKSHTPVILELAPVFMPFIETKLTALSCHPQDNYGPLEMYAGSYCREREMGPGTFLEIYREAYRRELWQPENEGGKEG